jgi:hypothetical protein
MKNLYEIAVKKRTVIFAFIIGLMGLPSFAQESVIWNVISDDNDDITGSYSGNGLINVMSEGPGTAFTFSNFDDVYFRTKGGRGNTPSQNLTFYFNTPVIVTQFNVQDINYSGYEWALYSWNDSFTFSNNILFKSFTAVNYYTSDTPCCVSLNGVVMDPNAVLPNYLIEPSNTSWFNSDPVESFTLTYPASSIGLTSADLYYKIDLIRLPVIESLCINSTPPALPTAIGGGTPVSGTWNPAVINTSVAGNFTYTFTPNSGQVINYPVPIPVTILPYGPSCCIPNLTLVAPNDNINNLTMPMTVRHREASDWIKANNTIGVGDNSYLNLAVYNAGNFIELNSGFEAVYGSQFLAFQGSCNSNYIQPSKIASQNNPMNVGSKDIVGYLTAKGNSNEILITPNPSSKTIEILMSDTKFNKISITTIDGKNVYERNIENTHSYKMEISEYANGIYIVNVTSVYGQTFTKKLIKN